MERLKIKSLLENSAGIQLGSEITVKGWVRAFRSNRFIQINDGSCLASLQAVVDFEKFDDALLKRITTAACVSLSGTLIASHGAGQAVELQVTSIELIGDAHPDDIQKTVMQPKRHSLEFLREQAHLRFRTNTFGAVFRIRHAVSFAIHKFFNDRGFFNLHTPIITGSDAEGAGEMFHVSTLDPKNPPLNEDGTINYKEDFFGKQVNLTVSGQLEAELAALALGQVYTFGPTFRAENSNTSRHLAEFWMIEPEVAFNDLKDKDYQGGLLMVDIFGKFCSIIPIKSKTPDEILQAIRESFIKIEGKPSSIYSDDEGAFNSKVVQQYFIDNNIQSIITRTHAPVAERTIRTLKNMI
jgi:asparaginyl-tRNA synthetase